MSLLAIAADMRHAQSPTGLTTQVCCLFGCQLEGDHWQLARVAIHYHLKIAGLGHRVEVVVIKLQVVGAQVEDEGFALAFFSSTF